MKRHRLPLNRTVVTIALLMTLVILSGSAGSHGQYQTPPALSSTGPEPFSAPAPSPGRTVGLKGKFLISSPYMQDPRFYRTVILITKDDHEGSSGFILNRPTESLVSEAFPWHTGLKKKKDVIYWGGPVGVQQVFVLFRSKKKPDYSLNVLDDVYFTASVDILEEMARAKKSINRFRVILGYAGWAPGQMRSEIIRGDWLILSADADTIFMKDPSGMWENLRMLGGGQQAQRAPWNSHRKPSS